MKALGVINADGTARAIAGAVAGQKQAVGVYGFTLSHLMPKERRLVHASLTWNGGVSNGLVVQYCPAYSTDGSIVFLVSTKGDPGVKMDAAFSFSAEMIP